MQTLIVLTWVGLPLALLVTMAAFKIRTITRGY